MKFFTYNSNTYQLELNIVEILLIPELKALSEKDKAFNYFTYVYSDIIFFL